MDSLQGKRNRRKGKEFENKVQKDLEIKGWIVCRWTKKVEDNKLVNCKPKFNPFTKSIQSFQTGFPDFLCIQFINDLWKIRLIECKMNGYCNPDERKQIKYLKELGFIIEIASKTENGIQYITPVVNT